MAYTSQSSRRAAALLASTVAVLGLLTACGNGTGSAGAPQKVSGTAAPATDGSGSPSGGSSSSAGTGKSTVTASKPSSASSSSSKSSTGTGTGTGTTTSTRCHTSGLKASVGRNNPGAGQENFPIVLTNASGRTCTVRGYPGAAFVDASGKQLGPDPKRESGFTPTTVTLKPGQSAWAGLTFSNPEISGANAATPAALLVTPPDERASLKVPWTAGKVPVSGNASSVFLTVFSPGTGA